MKSCLSLFFTIPAKIIFSVVLFVVAVLFANCNVEYFSLYSENPESFINAIAQRDSFSYEDSHYYKNTVRSTIDNVTKLSMNYKEVFKEGASAEELLGHYNSIGDSSFAKIHRQLSSLKDFKFAFVNLSEKKIYSNIAEINGKKSTVNVRRYFPESSKTVLIAKNCKNPYFASDYFIDYAEQIRDLAKTYGDNFDLYISLGTEEIFLQNAEKYEKLHFSMRNKMDEIGKAIIMYIAVLSAITLILLTITGKQEPGGKTYPTMINRLPNDLIVIIYSIVLICQSSLYRTAFSMLVTHGNELDEFWFTHSHDFYTSRIRACIVVSVCVAINLICILKREYKMGKLFSNTYIHSYIVSRKKTQEEKKTNNK